MLKQIQLVLFFLAIPLFSIAQANDTIPSDSLQIKDKAFKLNYKQLY